MTQKGFYYIINVYKYSVLFRKATMLTFGLKDCRFFFLQAAKGVFGNESWLPVFMTDGRDLMGAFDKIRSGLPGMDPPMYVKGL